MYAHGAKDRTEFLWEQILLNIWKDLGLIDWKERGFDDETQGEKTSEKKIILCGSGE